MANYLKMALSEAIVTLFRQGWSKRRIARELGVDRGSVARHIAQAGTAASSTAPGTAKCDALANAATSAQVATGSAVPKQATPGQVATGSAAGEEAAKQ